MWIVAPKKEQVGKEENKNRLFYQQICSLDTI